MANRVCPMPGIRCKWRYQVAALAFSALFVALLPAASTSVHSERLGVRALNYPARSTETYAMFDPSSTTWALGNSTLEQRLQLGADGTLSDVSLQDYATGQLWNLTGAPIGLSLAGTAQGSSAPVDLTNGLQLIEASTDRVADGALELRIRLSHPASDQEITLEQRVRAGQPVVERRVTLTNHADRPQRISSLDTLLLGMPSPANAVWQAGTITTKGAMGRVRLAPGQDLSAAVPAVSGAPESFIPYLVLEEKTSGLGILAGLRWSSNWHMSATIGEDGLLRLAGGLHLDESDEDSLVLSPGETLEGPWSFLAVFNGDIDDAQLINSYMEVSGPARPSWAQLPPVVWNSWYAYLKDVNEQQLRAEADLAAELGVEVFYIDYGWSVDLGDWVPDPARFPSGLAAFADYVHRKGMKFGVWVAFGLAGPNSALARQHPEFLAHQPEPAARGIDDGLVLCLSAAEGWLSKELERIVSDYHVDWLKFDQPMIAECESSAHGQNSTPAGSLYANNAALYRILGKLGTDHPDLMIENSFNGGGYLDYGTRRYSDVAWLTDDSGNNWVAMPWVQQAFYGASYAFRPDYLNQWLAVVPGAAAAIGRTTSLDDLSYQAHSTMGGVWGISLRLTEMDERQLSLLRGLIDQYKAVRPLISQADFYHLTAPSPSDDPYGGGWMAVEYYLPESGQGAILCVRNGENSPSTITIRFQGLDPQARYRIMNWGDETSAQEWAGQNLLSNGLPLSTAPRQGFWLKLEKA